MNIKDLDNILMSEFNSNHMYIYSKCINEGIHLDIINELSNVLLNAYLESDSIPFNRVLYSGLSVIEDKYSVHSNILTIKNIKFINNIFNMVILDYNKRRKYTK